MLRLRTEEMWQLCSAIYPSWLAEQNILISNCTTEVIRIGSNFHDFHIADLFAHIFDLNNVGWLSTDLVSACTMQRGGL
jgi:hypothetical protein